MKGHLVEHLKSYGLRHFDSDEYWDWGAANLGKHAQRIDRLGARCAADASPARLREFMDYIANPEIRGVVASQQTDDLAQAIWMVGRHLEGRSRVLDVGCDVGMASTWFARVGGSGREVLGIDFAPKAVALATDMAARLELSNVRFEVADFERQLPPGPFDAIVDIASVQYARDPGSVYQRIRGGLSSDGVLVSIPMIGRASDLSQYLQTLRNAGFRVKGFDFVYARDLGRNVARPIVVAGLHGDSLQVDVLDAMRVAQQRVSGLRIIPLFEAATVRAADQAAL